MDLTSAVNAFETGNDNITAEMLGLEADATAQRDNVIRFMRGHSFNGESTGAPERRWLGAAPHGVPAVVTYGEDEASAQEVIYRPPTTVSCMRSTPRAAKSCGRSSRRRPCATSLR